MVVVPYVASSTSECQNYFHLSSLPSIQTRQEVILSWYVFSYLYMTPQNECKLVSLVLDCTLYIKMKVSDVYIGEYRKRDSQKRQLRVNGTIFLSRWYTQFNIFSFYIFVHFYSNRVYFHNFKRVRAPILRFQRIFSV